MRSRARRQERRRAAEAARRRNRRLRNAALGALVLVAAAVAVATFEGGKRSEVEGVEKPESQGRNHVAVGTPVDYGTPAPTSGPHYGERVADCGVHDETPPLPDVVHAMEHGAVVLWYRPDAADEARPRLLEVMSGYDSHVLVAPNPDIAEPVVATAWDRRLRVDDPDDPRLEEFVKDDRKHGPENVACPIR